MIVRTNPYKNDRRYREDGEEGIILFKETRLYPVMVFM
jgi:hypothetical protein